MANYGNGLTGVQTARSVITNIGVQNANGIFGITHSGWRKKMSNKTMDQKMKDIMQAAIRLCYGIRREVDGEIKSHDEAIRILNHLFPDLNFSDINDVAKSGLEMHRSLLMSVDRAGGAFGNSLEELFKMTYLDLLGHLATNKIRFIFDGIPRNQGFEDEETSNDRYKTNKT